MYSESQNLPACEWVRLKVVGRFWKVGHAAFCRLEEHRRWCIDDDKEQRRAGRVSQVQPSLGSQRVLVLSYKRALSSALYQVYLSKE